MSRELRWSQTIGLEVELGVAVRGCWPAHGVRVLRDMKGRPPTGLSILFTPYILNFCDKNNRS